MPLQNRVTPFGDIIATPEHGLLLGNRGIIHDPATKTLLNRRWTSKAWIICVCEFRGRRRAVMATKSWTELFFLDEATAFAAGHRPCFYCRRQAALAYQRAFVATREGRLLRAPEIDARLHGERLDRGRKRVHPLPGPPQDLPDGVMILVEEKAYLIVGGGARLWTFDGYGGAPASLFGGALLTPPASVKAFAAGYRPWLHPSAHHPPAANRSAACSPLSLQTRPG